MPMTKQQMNRLILHKHTIHLLYSKHANSDRRWWEYNFVHRNLVLVWRDSDYMERMQSSRYYSAKTTKKLNIYVMLDRVVVNADGLIYEKRNRNSSDRYEERIPGVWLVIVGGILIDYLESVDLISDQFDAISTSIIRWSLTKDSHKLPF